MHWSIRYWPRFLTAICTAFGCQQATAESLDERVDLVWVGDILLDSAPGRTIAAGGDPFANVAALLGRADAAIGNLECPVATSGQAVDKMFTFRANPSVLATLKTHIDVVSLANNHSGDYGPQALSETVHHLKTAGIPSFGAGSNLSEAHSAYIFERKGVRVALLGYDEFLPRWFEASDSQPGVAWSEDEQVVIDIRRARAQGADVVVPFLHWGWENEPSASSRQRELARILIDAGADAVVGCHPHVTQSVELYRGRPIVYSLGNFVFDLFDKPANAEAWMLRMTVDRTGVVDWNTWVVRIDAQGAPTPDPSALSPCGQRGKESVEQCLGGKPTAR
jgi:poly-gamma-glutamate capsule biosynthesis protein CapA/YwtB (metallophosphatase superfamily)